MLIKWLALALIHLTASAEELEKTLVRSRRAAVPINAIPWPNARIPYIIDKAYFKKDELRDLQSAIDVWNSETCVHFVPYRSYDKSWIRITDGNSCYSQYMGYKGTPGEQKVTLSKNGCRFYGLYLHELGHVIGLDHEHVRADRDEYLRVDTAGVPENLRYFFTKKTKNQLETFDSPYDLQSVMHYGQSSFSVFADKTPISVKDKKFEPLLKDVYVKDVSFWDVRAVNLDYKCREKCQGTKPKCDFPGFIDKNCKCQTPEGFIRRRCVDSYGTTKCAELADRLECYRNASFMTVNCRKTCGFCFVNKLSDLQEARVIACKDHHKFCKGWAREGQCIKAASYMEMMCPESCGYCNGKKNNTSNAGSSGSRKTVEQKCKDRYKYPADCEAWAKEGKCASNKIWMHFNCAKSCKICESSGSRDANTKRITTTTTSTPAAPKKVTTDSPLCKDLYGTRNCHRLAAQNMCKAHKSWMTRQCPLTCGFCHSVDTTPNPTKMATTKRTTTKESKTTTSTATTARQLDFKVVNNNTKTTAKPTEPQKVPNATVQRLEHCQNGDPPGQCPKYRSSCKTAEIFRKCPNTCKNCGPCEDASKSCAVLKKSGYCQSYPASTIPICRKTCGVCS